MALQTSHEANSAIYDIRYWTIPKSYGIIRIEFMIYLRQTSIFIEKRQVVENNVQFLKQWKVRSIEVLPENRAVQVIFGTEGNDSERFSTHRFGIGRRGARAAALARFASHAGFGDVEDLFSYVCALPRDTVGQILPAAWLNQFPDMQVSTRGSH